MNGGGMDVEGTDGSGMSLEEMSFEESLRYMEGLLRFGWKLGNERFTELCRRLGDPQDRYAVLHVAGTKGKGSTTALAAGILRAAGYRVGAYFSPYVYDPCERVQVNGELIPRADFARLVTRIRPHVEALAQTEFGQTTEFELKTALGFCWFAEQNVAYACIEVGLGGRLDATNIVKPLVTVITNIGLDHTQILGDTHALIAAEKAGIIKPGVPCITAAEHPDALAVIRRIAQERNAPLALVQRGDPWYGTDDTAQIKWDVTPLGPGPRIPSEWNLDPLDSDEHTAPFTIATPENVYPFLSLDMRGVYQRTNAACAVAAVEIARRACGGRLTQKAVREGLAQTVMPGRFEIVQVPDGPLVVLDGAHNDMAARSLVGPVSALCARNSIQRVLLVIGMLTGHAPEGVLEALAPLADRIFVCQPQWKRAQSADLLADVARRFSNAVEIICSVQDAARAAIAAATPRDLVLITGSFYTVGEAPVARWITLSDASTVDAQPLARYEA
jgi:dihydrofolate synthase/folylpolyglutamate synthase